MRIGCLRNTCKCPPNMPGRDANHAYFPYIVPRMLNLATSWTLHTSQRGFRGRRSAVASTPLWCAYITSLVSAHGHRLPLDLELPAPRLQRHARIVTSLRSHLHVLKHVCCRSADGALRATPCVRLRCLAPVYPTLSGPSVSHRCGIGLGSVIRSLEKAHHAQVDFPW